MAEYQWKAGQKVFSASPRSHWGGSPGRIRTIDRVTPSGRAVISSTSYDRTGREVGSGRWNRETIEPLTSEHEKEIADWKQKSELLTLVDKIKWRNLTAEQVELALPVAIALQEPVA